MDKPKETKEKEERDEGNSNIELPCVSYSVTKTDTQLDMITETFSFYARGQTSEEALQSLMALLDLSLSYEQYRKVGAKIKKGKGKDNSYMG